MPDDKLVAELARRLGGIAIVSSEITDKDLEGADIESVIAHVRDRFGSGNGAAILTREMLVEVLGADESRREEKVEIIRPLSFNPSAKGMKEDFKIRNAATEKTSGKVADFAEFFNDRLRRIKAIISDSQSSRSSGMMHSIESIKQYAGGREITIAGMVYEKRITQNGHVLVKLEDETGTANVLFYKPREGSGSYYGELFTNASKIINDEVIAVRGKISGPFVIANSLIYPDVPVRQRKRTEEDFAIAFMSDVHVGSKLFMQKQFDRFIEWTNGKFEQRRDLAEKLKYIVVSGDLVDGIGVYPNQDKELAIDDIYKQYSELFGLLSRLPEYVHVFLLTGNHDAVQRAEPQPRLPEEFHKDFKLSNVHFVSNPGYVKLGGLTVLGYHGTSLDSVIQGIPGCSYSKPEGAMLEVLKRRHLSPIYGDNPIVPSKVDSMVIDLVPDILHMGHIHKNGYSEYHGTSIINSGTWQARTDFQVRMGHIPTPAMLPVHEATRGTMSVVDFNNELN